MWSKMPTPVLGEKKPVKKGPLRKGSKKIIQGRKVRKAIGRRLSQRCSKLEATLYAKNNTKSTRAYEPLRYTNSLT